jgi:hypothetical protein
MEAPINTQPMRIRVAGPVDCELSDRKDLIVPAPTTHTMTQVGHNIVLSMYSRRGER